MDSINPDGEAAGTRTNAHGVDLNRNSGYLWEPRYEKGSRYWSGPRAWSEPESQIVERLVTRLRPDVTIWYHQPYGVVEIPLGDPRISSIYAERVGMKFVDLEGFPGEYTNWQNTAFPGATAFIVEFSTKPATATATATRHVAAVRGALTPINGTKPTP